jgi:hypothetical protein
MIISVSFFNVVVALNLDLKLYYSIGNKEHICQGELQSTQEGFLS